jgi:hypothetical protein
MAIIVFADMVSKMGMQPELAKRIVKEAIKRWVEMLKIQIKAVEKALLPGNENNPITIDDSEAVFLELVSINKDDFDFRRLTRSQLHEGFDKENFDHEDQQPRILIPLDSYYWNGLTKLSISIERQQELEKASSNLKEISDEEVSSRRRKLRGVWYT